MNIHTSIEPPPAPSRRAPSLHLQKLDVLWRSHRTSRAIVRAVMDGSLFATIEGLPEEAREDHEDGLRLLVMLSEQLDTDAAELAAIPAASNDEHIISPKAQHSRAAFTAALTAYCRAEQAVKDAVSPLSADEETALANAHLAAEDALLWTRPGSLRQLAEKIEIFCIGDDRQAAELREHLLADIAHLRGIVPPLQPVAQPNGGGSDHVTVM